MEFIFKYLPELRIACELILIGICLMSCFRYRSAKRESVLISQAGRNFLMGRPIRSAPQIKSTEGRSLLRLLQMTGTRIKRVELKREIPLELEIEEPTSLEKLGDSLISTIEHHLIVKPRAIRVFIRKDRNLSLLSSSGISSSRFGRIISELIESYDFEKRTTNAHFENNSLKSFDVREQFFYQFPLSEMTNNSEIILWLGFQNLSSSNHRESQLALDSLVKKSKILITQFERISKLEKELGDERDTFVGISHDLRAPGITALYLVRELMNRDSRNQDDNFYRELEVLILEQLSLIQDFLDIERSKISAIDIQSNSFDPVLLIREISDSPIVRCQSENVRFTTDVLTSCMVGFDRTHLKRILINLISNSFKYTTSGEVVLGLKESEKDFIEIFVSDTGRGISQEMEAHLFSKFQRLDAPKNISGNGIGLAASRLLAEKNGTQLKYSPRPGGGSIFSMILRKSEETTLPVLQLTAHASNSRSTVLVLEDDEATCRLYTRILAANGFEVEIRSSVTEALRSLKNYKKYSALIADFKLSDGDSFALLKELSQRGVILPTLIISGMTDWNKTQRQMREVMERVFSVKFLEKPIERAELEREFFQVLELSRPEAKEQNLR